MSMPSVVGPHAYDHAAVPIALTAQIAEGGEGAIWRTDRPGHLVKLYHRPTPAHAAKLEEMLAYRPKDPSENPDRPAIAWPLALVYDQAGACIGFELPEITEALTLPSVYLPALRKAKGLDVDWRYLHAVAYNVAVIMKALHKHGYVIGDLKPQNMLVDARANVTIIDTDSFQVGSHRCPVGSEGFTPPELIGLELAEVEQTPEHDRFRLGVLIYLLLFGRHPFQGVREGDDDPPPLGAGPWCHDPDGKLNPPPGAPELAIVGPELAACFRRCFDATSPADRPDAAAWAKALRGALGTLARCEAGHHYHQPGSPCAWCAAASTSGHDVFVPRPAPARPAARSVVVLNPSWCEPPGPDGLPRPSAARVPDYRKHFTLVAAAMATFFVAHGLSFSWHAPLAFRAIVPIMGLGFVAAAFAMATVFQRMVVASMVLDGVVLRGEVLGCEPYTDDDGREHLEVRYAFSAPNGRRLEGTTSCPRKRPPGEGTPQPGDVVAVSFRDADHHRAL